MGRETVKAFSVRFRPFSSLLLAVFGWWSKKITPPLTQVVFQTTFKTLGKIVRGIK
jgi:hypothetical protein